MNAVSAVIITYNEERCIERACRSVQWCDEIIVVDSGSDDRTVALAESLGARVMHHPFEGYGRQKRFAAAQARNTWILSLDADEEVSDALRQEIASLPDDPPEAGFRHVHVSTFHGKVLKYALGSGTRKLRLFNRACGTFDEAGVHEGVVLTGTVGDLDGVMFHDSYANLTAYFEKFNRYTSLQAVSMDQRGCRTSPARVFWYFIRELLIALFRQRGVLDGYEGILLSFLQALNVSITHAKLLEHQRRQV